MLRVLRGAVFAPSVRPLSRVIDASELSTDNANKARLRMLGMSKAPKRSAFPPARVGLLVILVGFVIYGITVLVG